ncbi:MAG: flagellar basal body P-ring formation chaperone FlgA [Rhodocyclaceae bacterium]|nr:flagellar basal body P-ring formation chaperone FlgA [Rhodocyclaceae bacterium]
MSRFSRSALCLALILPTLALAVQDPLFVKTAAEDFLRTQTKDLPGEINISVEAPSAGNKLQACNTLEAFLPPGSRAWGRTTVGIRCVEGASWSLYLRARVQVTGDYLVTTHALAPGQALGTEDVTTRKGELTQLPAGILTDPKQVQGKQASVSVPSGQALRADQLRQPLAVQQGQNVTVISRGEGFRVSTEGVALGNASAGQVVQVRIQSGQVRSGIAQPGGLVEMNY